MGQTAAIIVVFCFRNNTSMVLNNSLPSLSMNHATVHLCNKDAKSLALTSFAVCSRSIGIDFSRWVGAESQGNCVRPSEIT